MYLCEAGKHRTSIQTELYCVHHTDLLPKRQNIKRNQATKRESVDNRVYKTFIFYYPIQVNSRRWRPVDRICRRSVQI